MKQMKIFKKVTKKKVSIPKDSIYKEDENKKRKRKRKS